MINFLTALANLIASTCGSIAFPDTKIELTVWEYDEVKSLRFQSFGADNAYPL